MQLHKQARLQQSLLKWYDAHQRDLPWRNATDPYPVWISEVMLQQTQVQTVIPYYLRFLDHFPSIAALAQADTDALLRLWAGLGYYSRARNLQKAARIIVDRFGGKFPRTYSDVLALPGIGRYTAAAIVSIAFGQHYAVLDGNVSRVLARLFGIGGDPRTSVVQSRLWEAAQRLLPSARPGDFNQAMMELGATVCSPRQPRCLFCPWTQQCFARRRGLQELFPEKARREKTRKSLQAALVLRHRGRFLIVRRSDQGLLQGFWEFPSAELPPMGSPAKVMARFVSDTYGLKVDSIEPLMTVKHSITTRRIELQVFQAKLVKAFSSRAVGPDRRWVHLNDMDHYAFASASQRIVQALKRAAEPEG
jgi:A/G-specific adenine glycosylase